MTETNFDRLQKSRDAVRNAFAHHIKNVSKCDFEDFPDFLGANEAPDQQIKKIESFRDSLCGIVHVDDAKKRVLTRDARKVEFSKLDGVIKEKMANLSKLARAIDLIAAVNTMCEIECVDSKVTEEIKAELKQNVFEPMIKACESGEKINSKFYDQVVFNAVISRGFVDTQKKITASFNFRNLANEQRHILTITSHKNSEGQDCTVAEADVMMEGLTDEQRKNYDEIKKGRDSWVVRNNKMSTADISPVQPLNIPWFDALPEFEQKLVVYYIDDLLAGKVIPTQLRSLMCIKNAHSKEILVVDVNNSVKTVCSSVHSGALSFHGRCNYNDRLKVTQENIKQARSFLPEDAVISDMVFVSPINILDIEPEIVRQLRDVTNVDKKFFQSMTPLNGLRYISKNDVSGYKKFFHSVSEALSDDVPNTVRDFIAGGEGIFGIGRKEKIARNALENSQLAESDKALLLRILNARQLMDKRIFFDADNRNLQLAVSVKMIAFDIHQDAVQDELQGKPKASVFKEGEKINIPHFISHCKSGKDRDGLLEFELTHKTIANELGMQDSQLILKNLAAAGHTQYMASANGGSRGAHGIKASAATAMPSYYEKEVVSNLVLDTSKGNKFAVGDGFFSNLYKVLSTIANAIVNIFRYEASFLNAGQSRGAGEVKEVFMSDERIEARRAAKQTNDHLLDQGNWVQRCKQSDAKRNSLGISSNIGRFRENV